MRRACPKCGHLGKNATDFSPLGPGDDPRSSVGYADSVVTMTSISTANPRAVAPYKWICRPDEADHPFTEDMAASSLFVMECRWVPRPQNGRDLPVTRYWAFFRFGEEFIARV